MTTVRELIHQLTADYIDLDDDVQVYDYMGDLTTVFEVTATNSVVRIEGS